MRSSLTTFFFHSSAHPSLPPLPPRSSLLLLPSPPSHSFQERDLTSSLSSATVDVARLRETDFRLGSEALSLKKRKLEVFEIRRNLENESKNKSKEVESVARDTRRLQFETAELQSDLELSQSNYGAELVSLSNFRRSLLRSRSSSRSCAVLRSAALSSSATEAAGIRACARKLEKEKCAIEKALAREQDEEHRISERILGLEFKFKEAVAKRKEVRGTLSEKQLQLQATKDCVEEEEHS